MSIEATGADLTAPTPVLSPSPSEGSESGSKAGTRGRNEASGRFGCNRCGASWSGHRIEHCTVCHQSFSGTTAGDKHRTGEHGVKDGPNRRRCRTSDEMRDLGMAQNDRGIWTNGGESPWAR